jgi:uncharacterized protein
MSYETLEKVVADYMGLGLQECGFSWQGGEPTLMGLDFYKRVVDLQRQFGKDGQVVSNGLQTNSILLDDDWCRFLADAKFLVGISIDGSRELHDFYRKDFAGGGTFDRVYGSIQRCKEHGVEFNTLTVLSKNNADHADEILDFLIDEKIKYVQFIPCVETDPATGDIADFSVTPEQYGRFLCKAFDRWLEVGYQNLSVRDFDSILNFCLTGRHTICTFCRQCDGYIVIEHQGDAYCCDFFVTPDYYIGNIFETNIGKLASSKVKSEFSANKQKICNRCLVCRYLDVCRGGCMKDRISYQGQKRISYFCDAYKKFFEYSLPKFHQLAAEISTRNQ